MHGYAGVRARRSGRGTPGQGLAWLTAGRRYREHAGDRSGEPRLVRDKRNLRRYAGRTVSEALGFASITDSRSLTSTTAAKRFRGYAVRNCVERFRGNAAGSASEIASLVQLLAQHGAGGAHQG